MLYICNGMAWHPGKTAGSVAQCFDLPSRAYIYERGCPASWWQGAFWIEQHKPTYTLCDCCPECAHITFRRHRCACLGCVFLLTGTVLYYRCWWCCGSLHLQPRSCWAVLSICTSQSTTTPTSELPPASCCEEHTSPSSKSESKARQVGLLASSNWLSSKQASTQLLPAMTLMEVWML